MIWRGAHEPRTPLNEVRRISRDLANLKREKSSAGGGGFTPISQVITGSSTVTAPSSGASVALPWDGTNHGHTFLDVTTPTAPKWLTGGVYSISADVNAGSALPGDAGQFFWFLTVIGVGGGGGGAYTPVDASAGQPTSLLSGVYEVSAGNGLSIHADQSSGINQDVGIPSVTIVKFS